MKFGPYEVSNTSASRNRKGEYTYPAAIRIRSKEGVLLCEVKFTKRTHDPLLFVRKKYALNEEALWGRKELIRQMDAADIPQATQDAILTVNKER